MDKRVGRNRLFLSRLFADWFPGHAIIMEPEPVASGLRGDLTCSAEPVTAWLDWGQRSYEAMLQSLETFDDDSVPHVRIATGTQLFAAAFGCKVHVYEDSPPCALPRVHTAAEADQLEPPAPDAGPLGRVLEFGRLMADRLGQDVPIRVPDIQSPFDIAALIWRKQDLYTAMHDAPDAVRRLVAKCETLLTGFLRLFRREFAECSFAHCPTAWAPPELGCWLSEDEAGSMSTAMFEEFCLPSLMSLSDAFGGLFVHCCADADHQYASFRKIPNLRGMNRVFQASGPRPAIEAFTPDTVLMVAWTDLAGCRELLDQALPGTRYLFNMPWQPVDEARRTYEQMRDWCPRR